MLTWHCKAIVASAGPSTHSALARTRQLMWTSWYALVSGYPKYLYPKDLLSAVRSDSPSQCSSLGAINFDLLRMMYGACQGRSQSRTRCLFTTLTQVSLFPGDAGMKEYVLRTSKKTGDSSAAVSQSLDALRAHVRVYFPSDGTVASSLGGKHVSLMDPLSCETGVFVPATITQEELGY